MTGRAIPLSAEQTQDMIEANVRARLQVTLGDLAAAMHLSDQVLRRHLRALQLDERVHKVKPFGEPAPKGGIWAPGPAVPLLEGEPAEHEAVHLTTKTWARSTVPQFAVEAHFFGRAAASGVHA